MRLRKLLLAANILIIAAILFACGNQSSSSDSSLTLNSENNITASESKMPKTVKKNIGDKFSVDASVEAPETLPKEVGVIPVKTESLENKQKVMNILLGDTTKIKTIDKQILKDRFGKDEEQDGYVTASGDKNLGWKRDSLTFNTQLYFDIQDAAYQLNSNDISNIKSMENLYPPKDFYFMKIKDAEKKAQNLLDMLGIKGKQNFKVYSLDYQTMYKEQSKNQKESIDEKSSVRKSRKIRNWAESDDCYVFDFQEEFNGVPITQQMFRISNSMVMGPTMRIYYGTKGYISAAVYNVYEACGNETDKKCPMGLDQALDTLKNQYKDIIIVSPITVTNIEFSYVPVINKNQGNYQLTPCWIFEVSQYNNEIKQNLKKTVVFNALTGGKID